jgi:hypothetical protein
MWCVEAGDASRLREGIAAARLQEWSAVILDLLPMGRIMAGPMGEHKQEHHFRRIEVAGVVCAIAISIWGAVATNRRSDESNSIAKQALAAASEANQIAKGHAREYPAIELMADDEDTNFVLKTASDLWVDERLFTVINRGPKPLSGVQLKLIPMSGLIYSLDSPDETYKGAFDRLTLPIKFDEALLPGGMAHFDIRLPATQFQHQCKIPFKDGSKVYRMVMNVVILPYEVGEELPIQAPMQRNLADRTLVSVDYVPNVLWSEETAKALSTRKQIARVFPPDH